MSDSITAQELAAWMNRNGHASDFPVNDAFRAIVAQRAEIQNDDTTITQGELIKALEVIGYGRYGRENAVSWVRTVLEYVREPEWKAGDLARARDGVVVERTRDGEWKLPGKSESIFNCFIPGKPLKRLKEV